VQNPTYTASTNTSDSDLVVALTATATCDGPSPLADSDSTTLTVQPVAHTLTVTADPPSPSTVPSEGSTSLNATYTDSQGHPVASWSWDDAGAGGSFTPSSNIQDPTYSAPANTSDSDLIVTLTVQATSDGPSSESDSDATLLTVNPVPQLAIPQVLLEVHPNERAPGASDPQFLGWDPWTQPTSSPASSYWWKKYEFYANGPVWIQVCAQNWDSSQKGYGDDDNTKMQINGLTPSDYDGIQTGAAYQWSGSKEKGARRTLRFLHVGAPGKHSLWIGADESPVLWWIKVTDLEPGVIEAIE
jgi:hypothetical protein